MNAAAERRPVARLSRRWKLAAAHRLYVESFHPERNQEVFGKCNNPYGHGHNYVVEVTISGEVDSVTGMVADLAGLDRFAEREVLARFDHENLNLLPEFREMVPTTENFALVLERIFRGYGGATVERVRVEETRNNAFDLLTEAGARGAPATRER